MSERWRTELEKLRTLDGPPAGVWERAQVAEPKPPEQSGRARAIAAVVALALFVPAAALVWAALRSNISPQTPGPRPTASTPDVVHIVCRGNRIRITTPVVRVQSDGVHFLIDNPTGSGALLSRAKGSEGYSLQEFDSKDTSLRKTYTHFVPGRYTLGCVRPDTPSAHQVRHLTARMTIVDPTALFVSTQLTCVNTVSTRYLERVPVSGQDSAVEIIRRIVPGLQSSDQVVSAGYPTAEPSRGPRRVFSITRGGSTVASVRLDGPFPSFYAVVRACASSGIAPGVGSMPSHS